ncbi:PcfV, partial [Enterococcus faecalis]|nr:PcfV [Enterococcus faecalis]
LAILSIGNVNFPYIDDNARQIGGMTDFGKTYARWGSEFGSWLIQGSRHLTDMGLTSHIITALVLSLASMIAVYTLNGKKLEVIPSIMSTMIGLNPWFLQCISFRFDSPFMAASILFSLIPFLWWKKNNIIFLGVSIISIFLMNNTYQASSGIYIIIVLILSLRSFLNGKGLPYFKIVNSATAYLLSMFLYLIELKLVPTVIKSSGESIFPNTSELPNVVSANICKYFNEIYIQSNKLWIVLTMIVFVLFFVSSLIKTKENTWISAILVLTFIIIASVLSFGIFIFYSKSIAGDAPRYIYGFAVFISMCLIVMTNKLEVRYIDVFSTIISCMLAYYILTFSFVYSATLNYQKESFSSQSSNLVNDLKSIVTPNRKKVYFNTLFKNSSIYNNTLANYPIISRIVPPNDGLYWPNYVRFNTYSMLSIDIAPINENASDMKSNSLVISNYYYN